MYSVGVDAGAGVCGVVVLSIVESSAAGAACAISVSAMAGCAYELFLGSCLESSRVESSVLAVCCEECLRCVHSLPTLVDTSSRS